MKNIAITGSGGFVGSFLYQYLKERHMNVVGLDIIQTPTTDYLCNLTDIPEMTKLFDQIKPSVIIHTAKLAKSLDYSESNLMETYQNNYITTLEMVRYIKNHHVKFIYFSTDYVYPGISGNYTELNPPYPINYYGLTKLLGEEVVRTLNDYVILRPTVIFGWHEIGMNFFMQLWRALKSNKEMKVPIDQISNPMYIFTLIEIVYRIIEKDIIGVFNCTGNDACSRYDFALKIANYFKLNHTLIKGFETINIGQDAKRPLNNSTSSQLLQTTINYHFPSLNDNFKHMEEIIYGSKTRNL